MRSQLTTVVLLAVTGSGSMYAEGQARVDVYLSTRDDSAHFLGAGKILASGIFEKIGIHVNWRTGELSATRGGAGNETLRKAFGIRTLEHAPESATPGALASARIVGSSGAEITIYKDRVLLFLNNHGNLAGAGVGYILAHELAHVIQGVGRHSASGILKAKWSNEDFEDMIFHKLTFTNFDVELMHKGLALQLASNTSAAVSESTER